MIMNEPHIADLLENLKSDNEDLRDRATQELWRIWFEQKGVFGLEMIRRAQMMLEHGNSRKAEELLTELIEQAPDFAEAWNRRAVLYYMQGRYREAIADCEMVVQLNSVHFGALHGLGLCHVALGDYQAAIRAFRQALEVQPHAIANQRWILECTAKLN
jgi:tetratricopeptide (TPR) repeat protein